MATNKDIVVNYNGAFDAEYIHGVARVVLAIEFEYRRTLMELVAGKTGWKFDLLAKTVIRLNRENKRAQQ